MSKSKGARRERELTNYLDDAHYAVMRAPSSGSATNRDLPDILAAKPHERLAIEAKSSKKDKIVYIDFNEIDALRRFAQYFNAQPIIAVRWDQNRTHYFYRPENCDQTPSGKYSMHPDRTETATTSLGPTDKFHKTDMLL